MASKRVLIVGGVAGGASCATRLRRLEEQAEIVVYERGPDVSFANCGLPYYVGDVIKQRQHLLVASPEQFLAMFNIEVRTRRKVTRIDRRQRTIEVRNVQTGETTCEGYDVLVLAPGAAPIRPRVPGNDLPGIFTVRNLEDTDRIRDWIGQHEARRAVVVGGGYIGLEMVENLVHRGMEVTLLERLSQVLPPVDPEMAVPIQREMLRQGVDVRLANALTGFEPGSAGSLTVLTQDGTRLNTDLVILGVGVAPDVRLAREAGLELGALGGIRVDAQMRTSDPAIFAVGDAVEVREWVTGQPALLPLAGPASRQGRVVADVICGQEASYRGSQGTAVVGLFGHTLAMTGANEKTLRRLEIPHEKVYIHAADHATYYPGAEMMALKLLFAPDSGQILGAQAVGRSGVEKRIDVIAMAIQNRATVFDLEEAELCYAPQYGTVRDPVNLAGFAAANILRGDVDVVHWDEWLRIEQQDGQKPLVLDVRPAAPGPRMSVPGSVKIPLGELRTRLAELPRDREIWVHCAVGRASYYAARILAQHGFQVRSLSGGITTYQSLPQEEP